MAYMPHILKAKKELSLKRPIKNDKFTEENKPQIHQTKTSLSNSTYWDYYVGGCLASRQEQTPNGLMSDAREYRETSPLSGLTIFLK